MIIWRGRGFAILAIVFGALMLSEFVTEAVFDEAAY